MCQRWCSKENNYFPVTSYRDYLAHYESSPWKSKGKQQLNSYKQWLMRILRKDDEVRHWEAHHRNKKKVSHTTDSRIKETLSFPFMIFASVPPPLPFPLSSNLCSLFSSLFFSLYFLGFPLSPCLCLLHPPSSLISTHILQLPSSSAVSQYCMEVYCKHIWVPCCYFF